MSCIYGIEQSCSECRMCQSKKEEEHPSTETNNKAILVIDMPKSCEECPMIIYGEECILQDKDTNFSDITWDELRESCPLKAIPSKRNIETFLNKEYIRGWNACVDAIL